MKIRVLLFLVLSGLSHTVLSQGVQTITQDGTIKIDEVGHAKISFKTQLNAMQWQNWMQIYGNAQHVLKRDMQHEFSTYHVTDFSVDRNDSDRNFTLEMAADGAGVYRGGDRWEVELEEGRATKLTERQWLVQMTQNEGGALLQQNVTIELPEGVQSSAQATGEFGEDVIRYVLATESGGGFALIPGIALTVIGLILLTLGLLGRKSAPVVQSNTAIEQNSGEPVVVTSPEKDVTPGQNS